MMAADCYAQVIEPLPIAVTVSVPVPGEPVKISWSFKNTGKKLLMGNVVTTLNGDRGNAATAINTQTVLPGKSLSGTYAVLPSPGWSQFSVQMIYTHNVTVGGSGKTTPLTPLSPDTPAPKADSAPATHSVVVESAVAQGTIAFNASPASPALAAVLSTVQRQQVMQDYAPLLLYSYDHDSNETYRPIDVTAFVAQSSLAGSTKTTNLSDPFVLLDPNLTGASGTITANQPVLPAKLYVKPSQAARAGADWASIVQRHHANQDVGLYDRAFLVDVANLNDDADPGLKARLLARYRCTSGSVCPAQVIKIEYWQFFGFSHDYDGDSLGAVGHAIQDEVDHDGDWCAVTLYVDAAWWLSARPDRAILAVYHYLHGEQVGFDMDLAGSRPGSVVVPARAAADARPRYPALEYGGPNTQYKPQFSIKAKGVWLPLGGPDMTTELAHAQNNILQLAADPGSPPVSAPASAEFRHPVVYVEWGGHEFWPTPDWSIYGASKHNGLGQYSYFGKGAVDLGVDPGTVSKSLPTDINLVRFFAGYWGADGGGGPPQGPALHKQWYWNPKTTPQVLLDFLKTNAVDRTF